jgi:hypothetical protein
MRFSSSVASVSFDSSSVDSASFDFGVRTEEEEEEEEGAWGKFVLTKVGLPGVLERT